MILLFSIWVSLHVAVNMCIKCRQPYVNSSQHTSKEIKVFCQECQVAVCMMCFIRSDIEEVSDSLRRVVVLTWNR